MPNLENSIQKAIDEATSLKKKLNDIEGKRTYTFKELFNDEFMQAHTNSPDISSFLDASGLDFSSQESLRNIDEFTLDEYISTHSDFQSWHDMKFVASKEMISRQLKS